MPKKKEAQVEPEVQEELPAEKVAEKAAKEVVETPKKKSGPELVEAKIQGQRVSGYVTDVGGRKTLTTLNGVTYDV